VFARRARASGACGAWAGGLRLLRDDPFRDLLARNGWLHILEPSYLQEVREALQYAFPPGAAPARRRAAREISPPRPPIHGQQPSLFEGM